MSERVRAEVLSNHTSTDTRELESITVTVIESELCERADPARATGPPAQPGGEMCYAAHTPQVSRGSVCAACAVSAAAESRMHEC